MKSLQVNASLRIDFHLCLTKITAFIVIIIINVCCDNSLKDKIIHLWPVQSFYPHYSTYLTSMLLCMHVYSLIIQE